MTCFQGDIGPSSFIVFLFPPRAVWRRMVRCRSTVSHSWLPFRPDIKAYASAMEPSNVPVVSLEGRADPREALKINSLDCDAIETCID